MRSILCTLLLLGCFLTLRASTVVFLGPASDSDLFAEAFQDLRLPAGISFEYHCVSVDDWAIILDSARRADILILNARGKELRQIAEQNVDYGRTKLYALSSRLLKKGIPALEPPEMTAYRENRRSENFRNMVYWIVNRELDSTVKFTPPLTLPKIGLTHPAAEKIFCSIPEYRAWAEKHGHFLHDGGLVAFAVHSASINKSELELFRHVMDESERQGVNCVLVYGDEVRIIRELLLDSSGKTQVDAILALSFKFKAGLGEPLRLAVKDLDVPIFNALRLYRQTTPEWEASTRGMNDFSVAFSFIAPEMSGMIEPSLLFGSHIAKDSGGRNVQISEPFPEQIRNTVSRLKKWIALRRKVNREKRIAVFIYNGAGGKQNIGASYLNVPRSLVRITGALAAAGYQTGGLEKLDEAGLIKELLRSARNVGSWAPGELDELLAHGDVVRLPVARYKKWFSMLPEKLQQTVISEWGAPDKTKIMRSGSNFILPMLRHGNLTILPEPMRGWIDDPQKLVHSKTLPPPHQYLAVYLWLQHEFQADAMIHLGRHGSSEWLPGKQLGLSFADAPTVVRGNIPEIYPYISDGIGEGIVAKRRAQAVMIDHLTPFLKTPGNASFLPELKRRLSDFQTADPAVQESRLNALWKAAKSSGLTDRLDLKSPGWEHRVEDYVENCDTPAPFGLHSFGEAPSENEIRQMISQLSTLESNTAAFHLRNAGRDELRALLHALNGGFIEPGPSGDPLRRSDSLPVGRNFYSFDPAKVPTPDSMKTGAKLAEELLERERKKLGHPPRSVAIVLWAGESIRTDGVNEAMALSLMGMTLQYDKSGRVSGVIPVPGTQLKHPRIDVLLTTSGAYRDQFGDLIRLLDKARRQAAKLNDVENFIRRDAPGIFFPAPGTYGTRINKLAGASGLWEKDDELAAVYLRNMANTVDEKGKFIEDRAALGQALKLVETVIHSRSGNVYGVTDIDDMYQYLGGLSLAVKKESGHAPSEYIVGRRKRPEKSVSELRNFMAAELDSRLFNREWIQRMMQENYSGGKTLARMTDNVWGWQAVTSENITEADWTTLYEIYVKDRYALDLKTFFAENNEWAYQSMTGRMLEAVRKGYWKTGADIQRNLASEYARSVIRQGMACCDHTCNNPLLNQMVVNLISMPGVLSPEMVMKFQVAVEKAGGKKIGEQIQDRRALQNNFAKSFGKQSSDRTQASRTEVRQMEQTHSMAEDVPVKGFRMKPTQAKAERTNLASSGLKWTILGAVFILIGIFACGCMRKER